MPAPRFPQATLHPSGILTGPCAGYPLRSERFAAFDAVCPSANLASFVDLVIRSREYFNRNGFWGAPRIIRPNAPASNLPKKCRVATSDIEWPRIICARWSHAPSHWKTLFLKTGGFGLVSCCCILWECGGLIGAHGFIKWSGLIKPWAATVNARPGAGARTP